MGKLRITCPQEFGRLHVAPLVAAFLDANRGVSADILMVDRITNLVEEGIDVAVRVGPLVSSELAAIKVGEVRQVICAAPAYLAERGMPTAPSDLARHQLIATPTDAGTGAWRFGRDEKSAVRITPRLTMNSVAASIDLARRGWGLCRALSYQIARDVEEGTLQIVLVDHEPAPIPIHLVHVEGRRAAGKVRAFLEFAAPHLRQIAIHR